MLYSRLTFTSELNAEAILPPFKGSTFRGAFGTALKRVVCALERQDCQSCLLNSRCVYSFFFEKKEGCTKSGVNLPSPPHPFVIEPPLTLQEHFKPGDSFDFNLLLFGQANDYLPYCIYAFDQMGQIGIGRYINGKRAGFILKTVSAHGKVIYSSQDQRLSRDDFTTELKIPEPQGQGRQGQQGQEPQGEINRLTIHLKTPLRLKHENHLKADLPFHILIRAALRRISSLFACYGEGQPALDYTGLVARAQDQSIKIQASDLHWFDWERYSNRQEVKMLMGGIVGSISYTGNLGEFLPLLRLCEEVHLGKQSTFGLGQIVVEAG
ncbi:MAG: CRISPR system precrRNA processing endoribonuclease RAMP protein Cas6 [bacterium]